MQNVNLMSRIVTVQVCDATGAEWSYEAGNIKNKKLKLKKRKTKSFKR